MESRRARARGACASRLLRCDRARSSRDRVERGPRTGRPRALPRGGRRALRCDGLHPVHARVQRPRLGGWARRSVAGMARPI